jgi:hypothetical protein
VVSHFGVVSSAAGHFDTISDAYTTSVGGWLSLSRHTASVPEQIIKLLAKQL